MEKRLTHEAGIEVGLTVQPAQYESIKVSVSYKSEAFQDEMTAQQLFYVVAAEVEKQLAKQMTETKEGFTYLKHGGK